MRLPTRPNKALQPTAAPLFRSGIAENSDGAVRSTATVGGCG